VNLSVFHVAVAMFLLGSLASSTSAQAAGKRARSQALRAPAPLTVWLRAVDATPSAAQLARTHRKAAWWLDRVARDRPTPTMIRHRAIALLAILTSRGAERRLHRLLTIKEPAFRASAAVAWASGPGRRRPAQSVDTMRRALGDTAAAVRKAAARALVLYGDSKVARSLAVQRRAIESDAAVRAVLDATIRRLDRRPRRQRSLPDKR